MAERERGAKGVGGRYARLSRRCADAGRRGDEGREATRPEGCSDDHKDPGSAHFVWRRASSLARPRRPGRSRVVARRVADHISFWRRRDGARAPQARIQLGHQARLQRRREDAGRRVFRRVDHSRKSSRRLGERRRRPCQRARGHARGGARDRRTRKIRMEAETDDRVRRLGRRRAGADRLDRMGRTPRRRAFGKGRRLYQLRFERSWFSRDRRLAHAREVRKRARKRRSRSADETFGLGAGARESIGERAFGPAQGDRGAARHADLRSRIRLGLHAVSAASRDRQPQYRIRRRGRRRIIPFDL